MLYLQLYKARRRACFWSTYVTRVTENAVGYSGNDMVAHLGNAMQMVGDGRGQCRVQEGAVVDTKTASAVLSANRVGSSPDVRHFEQKIAGEASDNPFFDI